MHESLWTQGLSFSSVTSAALRLAGTFLVTYPLMDMLRFETKHAHQGRGTELTNRLGGIFAAQITSRAKRFPAAIIRYPPILSSSVKQDIALLDSLYPHENTGESQ